jgi:hypothetical protein
MSSRDGFVHAGRGRSTTPWRRGDTEVLLRLREDAVEACDGVPADVVAHGCPTGRRVDPRPTDAFHRAERGLHRCCRGFARQVAPVEPANLDHRQAAGRPHLSSGAFGGTDPWGRCDRRRKQGGDLPRAAGGCGDRMSSQFRGDPQGIADEHRRQA